MYSTANGDLVQPRARKFIGAPGLNSRQSPLANIDSSYMCAAPYDIQSAFVPRGNLADPWFFRSDNGHVVSVDERNPKRMTIQTPLESEPVPVVAMPTNFQIEPQLQQAVVNVWQPGRFAQTTNEPAHALATTIRDRCFFKDVTYPNGSTLPLAVRDTPMCIAAAQAAMEQVVPALGGYNAYNW